MNLIEAGGYASLAGLKILQHPQISAVKGIRIPEQPKISPENEYRAKQWYATKPYIKAPSMKSIQIDSETWMKRRVRDNQNGLKASEGIHGLEWYTPKIEAPKKRKGIEISPETYNINAAIYKYGRAELPPSLGKDLSQGDKVLQRAPGDMFITKSSAHNDQVIQDPSGVYAGVESMKLK